MLREVVRSSDPVILSFDAQDHILPGSRHAMLAYYSEDVVDPVAPTQSFRGDLFDVTIEYCSLYGEPFCTSSARGACVPSDYTKKECSKWESLF